MAVIRFPVSKDTYCRSDVSDRDLSHYSGAICAAFSEFNQRLFLEFDISDGPDVAIGVHLEVYIQGDNDGHIDFARLIEEFTDPITWDNSPFATSVNAYSYNIPATEEFHWRSFDVTKLYNDAKAAGMNTLGIRWKYQTESTSEYNARYIKTKEAEGDLGALLLVSFDCPDPTINGITATPSPANINEEVSFTNTGEDAGSGQSITERLWDFGDGSTATQASATHTYTAAGTYTVRYTITNSCDESTYKELPLVVSPPAPTISSISWDPEGDHISLAAGTILPGNNGTTLRLLGNHPGGFVNPPFVEGEAWMSITDGGDETTFVVAEGDHFRFDNKEWWALNIICGPEVDLITIADEVAEFEKIPKIGDVIQFAANIDWHEQEIYRIRWYYAKAPNRCFADITDLDWTEFAVGENTNMPAHTFEDEGDEEITFLRVTATNTSGDTGMLDTLCGPIFNLWKYKPTWWDALLEKIRTVNAEDIAHPIVMLSENVATMPGWTEPPFECPICNQTFNGTDSELNYAKHLMAHITAFKKTWFEQ